jgi:glycosyltransferase involved in cell wall biosynthesis
MKLSVVIITKNEERNIERCLQSIIDVADEIVVVDSFSTDYTITLCEKYDVRVIQRKFEGYGSQKQFATDQANFDYVLSLDADEELSNELKASILTVKKNLSYDCYSFNRRNFYCNKLIRFCGWYPDKKNRLFDKRKVNWNNREVHETVDILDKKQVLHLKGNLNHYRCSSIEEHREKENQYSRMNADILIKERRSVSFITPYLKGSFRFFKTYILQLGVLDGYYGFMISKTLANSSFRKYALVRKGTINNMA